MFLIHCFGDVFVSLLCLSQCASQVIGYRVIQRSFYPSVYEQALVEKYAIVIVTPPPRSNVGLRDKRSGMSFCFLGL